MRNSRTLNTLRKINILESVIYKLDVIPFFGENILKRSNNR